jgi:hypothetical protein
MVLIALGVGGVVYHYSQNFFDWLRFQSIGTRDYVVERLGLTNDTHIALLAAQLERGNVDELVCLCFE